MTELDGNAKDNNDQVFSHEFGFLIFAIVDLKLIFSILKITDQMYMAPLKMVESCVMINAPEHE